MNSCRVSITTEDVRAARRAWRAADDLDPASARTRVLYESYRDVVSAQAQQIADDFRRDRVQRAQAATEAEGSARPRADERRAFAGGGDDSGMESIVERVLEEAASRLTAAERAVLAMLPDDGTLEEIASRLSIGREAVVAELRSAYLKLGVSTRAQATAWVRRHDIA